MSADGDALDLDELERIARAADHGPWEAVSRHIAAASPGTVLALLERIQAAEARANFTPSTSNIRLGAAGSLLVTLADVEAERDELRATIAEVRTLVDAEVQVDLESDIRAARSDVRCLDCDIRYAERQDYGCFEDGRAHRGFTDEMLSEAEQEARQDPREYVTLSIADLRTALDGGRA